MKEGRKEGKGGKEEEEGIERRTGGSEGRKDVKDASKSAPQGQHVPESGNVFVFDSGNIEDIDRALLVDFEGEDGAVPKSLLRRLGKFAQKGGRLLSHMMPKQLRGVLGELLSTP